MARAESDVERSGNQAAACIVAAAGSHRLPAGLLLVILDVEGGAIGGVSRNSNGTIDIGPMQVNDRWLPALAQRWHAPRAEVYAGLRDNFCANVEAGAWILRQAIDEAHGDFWDGVALYHSHDPAEKAAYLRSVLRRAISLELQAQQPDPPAGRDVMAPSGRGAWPSSDDYTWLSLAVIVCGCAFGGYLLWTFHHAEISAAVMLLQHWQMTLIHPFTDRYDLADRQVLAADPAAVTFSELQGLCRDVGTFLRFPAALFIAVLGVCCLIWAPPGRYRRKLDLDGLIREQAQTFRTTAPFVARVLRLVSVRDGEPRPADPALNAQEWIARWATGKDGKFDEAKARSELMRQLGPLWQGVRPASPSVRVMFALFALHLALRREEALDLLGHLAESFAPAGEGREGPERPLAFAPHLVEFADHLLRDPDLVEPAAAIARRHAYTTPALMSVLTEARARAGVLAPAQFNFLKLVDRRLWYALHALGFPMEAAGQQPHPNARVEALGARDHWEIECIAGVPLVKPMVDRAVAALSDVALGSAQA